MSSQRRYLRSSAHRRRQQRQRQSIAESTNAGDRQVVDLTCANYEEQFVDLTTLDGSAMIVPLRSLSNSPIVIPATPTPSATRQARSERDAHTISDSSASSDEDLATNEENLLERDPHPISDSDEDLPPVPFKITDRRRSTKADQSGGSSRDAASSSQCPICLESFTDVKSSGCRVMATTCGHVFCEECLRGVLNGPPGCRKCPTCRKKISTRSVHPLYI